MTTGARETKPSGSRDRGVLRSVYRHDLFTRVIVLLAVIGAMAIVTGGRTISSVNAQNILLQSSMRGITSIGQTFVVLTAGLDLSVGGIGLFTSILGASVMTTGAGLIVITGKL